MLPEEAVLHNTFSRILPGFGHNHARILHLLINKVSKNAKQIEQESKLAHNTVLKILSELNEKGLLGFTNTRPKYYYCLATLDSFDKLCQIYHSTLKTEFKTVRTELKQYLENATAQSGEEYLVKILEGQTTLYNAKTKEEIVLSHEIEQLRQKLAQIPAKKKEKEWQLAFK